MKDLPMDGPCTSASRSPTRRDREVASATATFTDHTWRVALSHAHNVTCKGWDIISTLSGVHACTLCKTADLTCRC